MAPVRRLIFGFICLAILPTLVACQSIESAKADGPLIIENGSSYFTPAQAGEPVSIAQPQIENTSGKLLTLDSATLLIDDRAPQRLSLQSEVVALPERKSAGGILRGEPDARYLSPWQQVGGTAVRPNSQVNGSYGQGYTLIFVVDLGVPGIGWAKGVEVRYHIGSQRFVVRSDDLFVICTPVTARCDESYSKLRQ